MKCGLMIPLNLCWMLEMYGGSLFFLLLYNVGRFATTYFWKFHVSMYILSLNMYILIDVLGLLWTMRPCSWVLSSAASSWWRGGILKTQTELQIRGGNFCTFYFHYSIWKFDSILIFFYVHKQINRNYPHLNPFIKKFIVILTKHDPVKKFTWSTLSHSFLQNGKNTCTALKCYILQCHALYIMF